MEIPYVQYVQMELTDIVGVFRSTIVVSYSIVANGKKLFILGKEEQKEVILSNYKFLLLAFSHYHQDRRLIRINLHCFWPK